MNDAPRYEISDEEMYARTEKSVRAVLIKHRRTRTRLDKIPAIRLEPMHGGRQSFSASVPSDALCWTVDVDKILESLSDPSSRWFVHVSASRILVGDLVNGENHQALWMATGIKPRAITPILEGAVVMFFAHFTGMNLDYERDAA